MASTTGNIIHFLDDFLESTSPSYLLISIFVALEGLPQEIRREMEQLAEKDKLYEGTISPLDIFLDHMI